MDQCDAEDKVLLDRWRHGDRESGHLLINRHYDAIYNFVKKGFSGDADVADIVQSVFETIVRKRDKISRGFLSYAYCTARLKVLEKRREQRRSFDELPRSSQLGDHARGASSMLDRARMHGLMVKAFKRLGTRDQCILIWKYIDERTQSELGLFLGMTKNEINGRLNRARQRWRRAIRELLDEYGESPVGDQIAEIEQWLESVYGVARQV